jgi:GH25 family lysozyme M1 (1,4-beta-N-acetylmuramidase)
MKALFQRITAVCLAVLLCFGAAESAFAVYTLPSPACTLGTTPSDMLAGGGHRVQADGCVYYVNETDGNIYTLSRPYISEFVADGPAAALNYADGVLYFARPREADFDLCALDLETGTERILLEAFPGSIDMLYLVNGKYLDFSCGDTVWQFPLQGGECTVILTTQELRSFVPTGSGLIYATGGLFDYTLYANGKLVSRHVEDYTVRFDLEDGLLVYTCDGKDVQMNLAELFAGVFRLQDFEGLPIDPDAEDADPEGYVPNPVGTSLWYTGAVTDGRTKYTGAYSGLPKDSVRQPQNDGTMNIVRRARQMLNIQWTPVDLIGGWGYTDPSYGLEIVYEPEVTYTGLPYGQALSYVPWNTSYAGFINSVNEINSKMYTERVTYERGSQYYGTDCSAFVSWAWQTPSRKVCTTLMSWENTVKVGRSYTDIRLGDALISRAHAVLVTDVTYTMDGKEITSIELSQANPTSTYNGCCYSTRYTGTAALQSLNNSYFMRGSYSIYRNTKRNDVTYTHDCMVPVEGDVCSVCGYGSGSGQEDPYVPVGIDVSAHNGAIDWNVAATQIDFAILRIGYTGNTEGGIYKDNTAAANIQGCVENDIPFGLYYYAGATTPEKAMEEADAVLGWLLELGVTPSLPIFYDVEEPRNILTLSDSDLAQVIAAFCDHFGDVGIRSGVYASASLWDNRLTGEAYDRMAHWVAHWETGALTAAPGASLWQYTNGGKIAGVSGEVDMNYWIGTLGNTEHPSTAQLTAPRCLDGKLVSTCVKCDLVQELPIRGAGHSPGSTEIVNELEPTCTETGVYEEVTYCAVCGEISSRLVIPMEPLGHAWELTGFLSEGETPHESIGQFTCSRCGETEEAELCAREIFIDMPKKSHWAHDAIDWAFFNGLFRGISENRFGLDMTMDRAMLVTVLYSIAGRPEVEGTLPFRDVKPRAYYYKPILWAYQNGVAGGTGTDSFSPTAPVTREQVAVMLLGFLRSMGENPEIHEDILDTYPDVDRVSGFAVSGMAWAVENGILSGSPVDGAVNLLPRNSASRAQVAVMFMQFTKLLQGLGLWEPATFRSLVRIRPGSDEAVSR